MEKVRSKTVGELFEGPWARAKLVLVALRLREAKLMDLKPDDLVEDQLCRSIERELRQIAVEEAQVLGAA